MNGFVAEKIRPDECDHLRIAAAVLAKIEDKGVGITDKRHRRGDRFGTGFVIVKVSQVDVADVAVHAFDLFKTVVDPLIEPAALGPSRPRSVRHAPFDRDRLRRVPDTKMLVLADDFEGRRSASRRTHCALVSESYSFCVTRARRSVSIFFATSGKTYAIV